MDRGPQAGEQFWQGLAGGTAVNGAYTNWDAGEPNQFYGAADPENFAHMQASGRWNDLPGDRNLNYIIEWGGDLLIDNPDINVSSDSVRFRNDYMAILQQIEDVTIDANFRGVQLLRNENIETTFNERNRNRLTTEGIDATAVGLGLTNDNFISKSEMTKILKELQDARETLREFGSSLQNDLSIINTRRDYTENTINTFEAGADDLTVADANKVGAEFLALQTREQLQFQVLSLSAQSNILDLFS